MWQGPGAAAVLVVALGALIAFPLISSRPGKPEKVRSVAAEVNATVPGSETLYAIDPGYQPFLFYVRARVNYLNRLADLPPSAHYFFVRANQTDPAGIDQVAARNLVLVSRVTDYRGETILVYKIDQD